MVINSYSFLHILCVIHQQKFALLSLDLLELMYHSLLVFWSPSSSLASAVWMPLVSHPLFSTFKTRAILELATY